MVYLRTIGIVDKFGKWTFINLTVVFKHPSRTPEQLVGMKRGDDKQGPYFTPLAYGVDAKSQSDTYTTDIFHLSWYSVCF